MNLKKSFSHIFFRIFISVTGVTLTVITALGVGTFFLSEALYKRGLEKSLHDSASLIVAAIETDDSFASVSKICKNFAVESGIRATIVSVDGKIIFDSDAAIENMTNHLNRPEIVKTFSGAQTLVSRFSNTLNMRMLYLATPAGKRSDGRYAYCVRLAIPEHNLDVTKNILAKEIGSLAILSILFSTIISFLVARQISNPIISLRKLAHDFAAGNLDSHAKSCSITEVSQLGKSMESMAHELKKKLHSLHKRNCELDEIFSHMSECVFICTDEKLLLKANAAAKKILDISFANNPRPDIYAAIKNRSVLEAIEKTFALNKGFACNIKISEDTEMSLESVPLPYESRTRRSLFVLHDISLARRTETQRREFVAAASHELKTPMTGVMTAAEILSEDLENGDTKKLVDTILENSKRMAELIEQMLLLSKIESAEYNPLSNFSSQNVLGIIERACAFHQENAKKHSSTIEIICPKDITINADSVLLELAVSNLLSNAIKYSGENSKIVICAKMNLGNIEISVEDNGNGIDPMHCERVFERFYRIEKGRGRNAGGSGIGLAIVKHVAAMHGGKALVESKVGTGTKFTLILKSE